jgi:peptide deformylase
MNDSPSQKNCPCGSGAEYERCCQLFHKGLLPKNALLLMRSRYSAYALDIPDYIIESTHPSNPRHSEEHSQWKQQVSQFSQTSSFRGLEILDFKENQTIASVTFTAYLSQENRDTTFTERSYFEKIKKRWYYQGGHTTPGRVQELVIPHPLRVLPLAYYGDPFLRKKAAPVAQVDDSTRKLIAEMVETMDAYDGIGLSAPQVHQPLRLFVIHTPVELDTGQLARGDIKIFINPQILNVTSSYITKPEMSLSIPGIPLMMTRPKVITVAYTSIDGTTRQQQFTGWEAALILHQYDHLEGVLFTDRLPHEQSESITPLLNQLEQRMRKAHDT